MSLPVKTKSDAVRTLYSRYGGYMGGKLRELLEWYRRQMESMEIEIHLNTDISDLSQCEESRIPKGLPADG